MLMFLTVIGLGGLVWFFVRPTAFFLRGFASLLESSDFNLAQLFWYRGTVAGHYKGRSVGLEVHQPADNRFGRIEVLMKTSAPDGSPWKDSALVSKSPEISRATFDLEGKYALVLSLSNGWLRAASSPMLVRFPGPFDRDKWNNVLTQMETLARWLEERKETM
jgi:hypothetical protein